MNTDPNQFKKKKKKNSKWNKFIIQQLNKICPPDINTINIMYGCKEISLPRNNSSLSVLFLLGHGWQITKTAPVTNDPNRRCVLLLREIVAVLSLYRGNLLNQLLHRYYPCTFECLLHPTSDIIIRARERGERRFNFT